jgi:transposase-like protein
METTTKTTVNWQQIKSEYQGTRQSVRDIARKYGITHTAVNKQAKRRNWTRPKPSPDLVSRPVPIPPEHRATMTEPAAEVAELVKRGRGIVLTLMAELEVVNAHVCLLTELMEVETAEDKGPARLRALQRALSFPSRAQAAKNLANALATLRDAAPGKKDQARIDANTASQDSDLAFDGGGQLN